MLACMPCYAILPAAPTTMTRRPGRWAFRPRTSALEDSVEVQARISPSNCCSAYSGLLRCQDSASLDQVEEPPTASWQESATEALGNGSPGDVRPGAGTIQAMAGTLKWLKACIELSMASFVLLPIYPEERRIPYEDFGISSFPATPSAVEASHHCMPSNFEQSRSLP